MKHEFDWQDAQWKQVEKTLQYVQQQSPYYQQLFQAHNLTFEYPLQHNDFLRIPCTGKEALQHRYLDFLCIREHHVAEYTATTGTLGKAVQIALSNHDLDRLAENEANSFELMELSSSDKVQLMLTLDRQFMAGMAYYSGLRKAGIASVRCGPALPAVQLETALQLQTTVWIAVPSFILKLIQYATEHQFDVSKLAVKKILCIGENIRDEQFEPNSLAQRITAALPVQLFSTYASTEMQTAFTECSAGQGGHYNPNLIYAEVLDEDGNHVQAGSYGELVITTLHIEAMPMLRYRTGDVVCMHTSACSCGRMTPRISPVLGRKNQMIKVKGTTLFPSLLHHVLHDYGGVTDYVVEVSHDALQHDQVVIYVCWKEGQDVTHLKEFLKSRLRFVPELMFKTDDDMQALLFQSGSRKPQRFIDLRKNLP